MHSSMYAPLQGEGRQFRLLILEPSNDRLAPIECRLIRVSYDISNLKYTALSYVWGDAAAPTSILVNGVERQVTLNLGEALRHLRRPAYGEILWVDALCINQEDLAEKNHQVGMMREIYSGAELVIAWLGSASGDSDLAMEVLGKGLPALLETEGKQRESAEHDFPSHPGNLMFNYDHGDSKAAVFGEGSIPSTSAQSGASMPDLTMPDLQLRSLADLYNFEEKGTLPDNNNERQDEHQITREPIISSNSRDPSSRNSASSQDGLESDSEIDDEREKEYVRAFKRLTEREALAMWALLKRSWWSRIWVVQEVLLAKKVTFKCGDAEASGEQMSSWTNDALFLFETFCNSLGSTGHIFPAIILLRSMLEPNADDGEGLPYFLFQYSMREASRPHDHFYGLLGIISETHQMLLGAPDYGCRAEDLFTKVACKLMVEYNSLILLGAAGMLTSLRATSSTRLKLPSWVPDWTRQFAGYALAMSGGIPTFSSPEFHFSDDSTELTLIGFKFDKIESTQSVPARAKGKMPMWHGALLTDGRKRDDRVPPPLEGLIFALLGPEFYDRWEFPRLAGFFKELEEYRISVCPDEASGDHDSSDYLAGFLDWIGETRDGRTDEEILQKVFSAEDARSFVTWYHRQSTEDLQYAHMVHSMFRNGIFGTEGFLMFRTSKGSFGLTHAPVAPDDILCAVPTCPSPLVLRNIQFSRYALVGPSALAWPVIKESTKAVENGELKGESYTLV